MLKVPDHPVYFQFRNENGLILAFNRDEVDNIGSQYIQTHIDQGLGLEHDSPIPLDVWSANFKLISFIASLDEQQDLTPIKCFIKRSPGYIPTLSNACNSLQLGMREGFDVCSVLQETINVQYPMLRDDAATKAVWNHDNVFITSNDDLQFASTVSELQRWQSENLNFQIRSGMGYDVTYALRLPFTKAVFTLLDTFFRLADQPDPRRNEMLAIMADVNFPVTVQQVEAASLDLGIPSAEITAIMTQQPQVSTDGTGFLASGDAGNSNV